MTHSTHTTFQLCKAHSQFSTDHGNHFSNHIWSADYREITDYYTCIWYSGIIIDKKINNKCYNSKHVLAIAFLNGKGITSACGQLIRKEKRSSMQYL